MIKHDLTLPFFAPKIQVNDLIRDQEWPEKLYLLLTCPSAIEAVCQPGNNFEFLQPDYLYVAQSQGLDRLSADRDILIIPIQRHWSTDQQSFNILALPGQESSVILSLMDILIKSFRDMDFNSALFKTIFTTIQSKALELIQVLIAQNPIIINFLDLVEHNYTRHWSVIEYADKLGISESYLHHLSARYLHLGPKTYIQNCLLAKAETLLVSQRTITEVADDLGFDHPGHFSRFIKNMTGVRPGKLKEKLRTMAIKS